MLFAVITNLLYLRANKVMMFTVSIRSSTSFILMLSFLSLRYNLDVKMLLW